jgi:hypothetical protein
MERVTSPRLLNAIADRHDDAMAVAVEMVVARHSVLVTRGSVGVTLVIATTVLQPVRFRSSPTGLRSTDRIAKDNCANERCAGGSQ